jgi:NADPH2:quinone reductase
MKAVLCREYGPPASLVFEEIPDPVAGPGDVVIDMRAAGVNFPDLLIIQNKYQHKPALPFTPGAELAGIVSSVGSDVAGFRVGDRVVATSMTGAFAEKTRVRAASVSLLPDAVSFDVGAALSLAYGTSFHALKDRAALQPGETLLVLGAAGGVGLAAVEIGKALGARVIAAASSAEKLAVCASHGADAGINYSTEDLRGRLRELTAGRGPDVIYDPVGGPYSEPAFRSIAWRGRFLVVGFANGEIPRLALNLPLIKGASIVGVVWGEYTRREPLAYSADLAALLQLLAGGQLRPRISARYSLQDVGRALVALENRWVTGKSVIINEPRP